MGYQHPDVREVDDDDSEAGNSGAVPAGQTAAVASGGGSAAASSAAGTTAAAQTGGLKKGTTPSAADLSPGPVPKRMPFYKRISGDASRLDRSLEGWNAVEDRFGAENPFLIKWDKVDSGLENFLEPCAKKCDGGGKDCDGFCGVGGSCCKKGDRSKGCGGLVGGVRQHVCVPKVRSDQILRDYYVSKVEQCDVLAVKTVLGTAQAKEGVLLCSAFERNAEWKGKVDVRVNLDSMEKLAKVGVPTFSEKSGRLGVWDFDGWRGVAMMC